MPGSPSALSGTFAGRYTVERELGRGATATVYLARDTERSRLVAIKVLRPELAQSVGAERFLREIKISEGLQHPHIVPVLDAGEVEGQLYFVLPHMEGGSLRQKLEREKQLPIEEAIAITLTIAEALDYAHKQGLIHRDVKPENILFTAGQACLADFGIARAIERTIDESTTSTGLVRGTPAYMSPEQASGSMSYDGRTDQYSLALVLYEMLAGIPAFIGATAESVIAQRFQHKPRELRVFRSTAPPALQPVLDKALSLAPADRYPNTAQFAAAVDNALRAPVIETRSSGSQWGGVLPASGVSRVGVVAALLILLVTGVVLAKTWIKDPRDVDATRFLVLSAEPDSSRAAQTITQLLHESLSKWKGVSAVTPFELAEAVGDRPLRTEARVVDIAEGLRAGSYIRAQLRGAGSDSSLHVALFETGQPAAVVEATVAIPIASLLRATVDSIVGLLLFRRTIEANPGTHSFPAMHLYLRALDAREAFDLRQADTLLLQALEHDREFGRAALAMAQVRAWREDDVSSWLPWAERAQADKSLPVTDMQRASAFVAMGRSDQPQACSALRKLALDHESDFAAWMNLATCVRSDNVVLPDPSSPSEWRFRSSYQPAVDAYVRAFKLAPALHRTFQPGGYDRLRRLLFTSTLSLRSGVAAAPDSQRFYAYASWRDGSIHFVPYPASMLLRGLIPIDSAGRSAAARHQRDVFRDIAESWAAALPTNPAAKEALAISLEMVGDPAALDTIRRARSMPADLEQRARFAIEEVLIRISLGRSNTQHLTEAARLADSLLLGLQDSSTHFAAMLRPVAAATGRCRLAGRLAARGADPRDSRAHRIPNHLFASVESVTVLVTMGCANSADSQVIANFERRIDDLPIAAGQNPELRRYNLLARLLRSASVADSGLLARYATPSGDPILRARLAMARRDSATVRTVLARRHTVPLQDRSADAVYSEAMLYLSLGDTAAAVNWLMPILSRTSWMEVMQDRPIEAAALIRAAVRMAELGARVPESGASTDWRAFRRDLWKHADAELKKPAVRAGHP